MRSTSDLLELFVKHVFFITRVRDIFTMLGLLHIFNFELVLPSKLQQFRFPLFKTERSGDLVIDV
jgi:hypothetical protein